MSNKNIQKTAFNDYDEIERALDDNFEKHEHLNERYKRLSQNINKKIDVNTTNNTDTIDGLNKDESNTDTNIDADKNQKKQNSIENLLNEVGGNLAILLRSGDRKSVV